MARLVPLTVLHRVRSIRVPFIVYVVSIKIDRRTKFYKKSEADNKILIDDHLLRVKNLHRGLTMALKEALIFKRVKKFV